MNKVKTSGVPDDHAAKAATKAATTTNPAASTSRKDKDFGLEGTNKTVPFPQPDAQPADELHGTKSKFIPKTPYTRG